MCENIIKKTNNEQEIKDREPEHVVQKCAHQCNISRKRSLRRYLIGVVWGEKLGPDYVLHFCENLEPLRMA